MLNIVDVLQVKARQLTSDAERNFVERERDFRNSGRADSGHWVGKFYRGIVEEWVGKIQSELISLYAQDVDGELSVEDAEVLINDAIKDLRFLKGIGRSIIAPETAKDGLRYDVRVIVERVARQTFSDLNVAVWKAMKAKEAQRTPAQPSSILLKRGVSLPESTLLASRDDTDEPGQSANVFRLVGNDYFIVFAGKETTVSNTKGAKIVKCLIENQGQDIDIERLDGLGRKLDQPSKEFSQISDDELIKQGVHITARPNEKGEGNVFEPMDPAYIRDLEDRREEIEFEIKNAQAREDYETLLRLDEEKKSIDAQFYKGKADSVRTPQQSVRNRVRVNYEKFMRVLKKQHLGLHSHLTEFVKTYPTFRYAPPTPTTWQM